MKKLSRLFMAAALAAATTPPLAHEGHGETRQKAAATKEHPWGRAGDPRKAVRTIAVDMADNMRFTPDKLTVRQGDTVKFVVANSGKTLHEMVIGTEEELRRHADLMKKHPGMEHDEPYMVHVQPGKKQEIAWVFTKPGAFMYGCLIPGHWDAGMKGSIVVTPRN
jgi:uncharacterized cupredoxin-like copper-binding protein